MYIHLFLETGFAIAPLASDSLQSSSWPGPPDLPAPTCLLLVLEIQLGPLYMMGTTAPLRYTPSLLPRFLNFIKRPKKKKIDLPLWMKQHKAYLPSWNGSNGLSILGKIPESAVDYTSYRPKTWFLSNKYLQIEKGMTLG